MSAVTPEMIEAGVAVYFDTPLDPANEMVAKIYLAMEAARSPTPHVDHWDALADFQSPDRTFLQISKTDFLARSPTSPREGDADADWLRYFVGDLKRVPGVALVDADIERLETIASRLSKPVTEANGES